MSLLSNIEEGIKKLYGEKYNAAEDFPPEVKIVIGEVEKEMNAIKNRLQQIEHRVPPRPVTNATPAA